MFVSIFYSSIEVIITLHIKTYLSGSKSSKVQLTAFNIN